MSDERQTCWMCAEGAMRAADEIERLRALVAKMQDAMTATRAYCIEHSQAQFDANVKLLRVLDASTAAIAKADEVLK